MRGNRDPQLAMLTTLSTVDLIPADHPIRKIRVVVDAVLAEFDPVFDRMPAEGNSHPDPAEHQATATNTRHHPWPPLQPAIFITLLTTDRRDRRRRL
jgi:hypothetical protein